MVEKGVSTCMIESSTTPPHQWPSPGTSEISTAEGFAVSWSINRDYQSIREGEEERERDNGRGEGRGGEVLYHSTEIPGRYSLIITTHTHNEGQAHHVGRVEISVVLCN